MPDPVDYIEMRRMTFGSGLTMALARLTPGRAIPDHLYETRELINLSNAAQDYACMMNDLFSYQKEIQFEGELCNSVLVMQNFFDCGVEEAVEVVSALMDSRMAQFEAIAGHDLPFLLDTIEAGEELRADVDAYVGELQDWMAAILRWHERTRRYPEADLKRQAAERWNPGPSGLGTLTTQITSLVGVL